MQTRSLFRRTVIILSVLILEMISFQPLGSAQTHTPAKKIQAHKPTQIGAADTVWDLVVAGGTVVTMDASRRIIENGIVVVQGDTVFAVELPTPKAIAEYMYTAKRIIDANGKLVLPGFINGHTHVPMTLFRGLHDDVTLDDWLRKYIFPAEAKNVTEDFVRWGTRLAAAEQIRSGITTFADMY